MLFASLFALLGCAGVPHAVLPIARQQAGIVWVDESRTVRPAEARESATPLALARVSAPPNTYETPAFPAEPFDRDFFQRPPPNLLSIGS